MVRPRLGSQILISDSSRKNGPRQLRRDGIEALLGVVLDVANRLVLTEGIPGVDSSLVEVCRFEVEFLLVLDDGFVEAIEHTGGVVILELNPPPAALAPELPGLCLVADEGAVHGSDESSAPPA